MQNSILIVGLALLALLAGLLLIIKPFGEETPGLMGNGSDPLDSFTQVDLDNAAAIVNSQPISEEELDFVTQANIEVFRQLYGQLGITYEDELLGTMGEYKRLQHRGDALSELINQKLQDSAIEQLNISVTDEEINERFTQEYDALLMGFGISEEELIQFLEEAENREVFRQVLFQSGIMQLENGDFAEFRFKIRDDVVSEIAREKLKEEIVGPINASDLELLNFMRDHRDEYSQQAVQAVIPTDAEIEAYFEANRSAFPNAESYQDVRDQIAAQVQTEKRLAAFDAWLENALASRTFPPSPEVRARHILISVSPDAPQEELDAARDQITQLRDQIVSGADFAEVANQSSEDPGNQNNQNGGDLGWFGLGRMVYPFEAAVFDLEVGEISEIIQTQFGYHIAQVTDHRETDQFRSFVETNYLNEQSEMQFQNWLARQIAVANIQINDPLLYAYSIDQQRESIVSFDSKIEVIDEAIDAYEDAQDSLDDSDWVHYVISALMTDKVDLLNSKLESGAGSTAERESLERDVAELSNRALEEFLMSEYSTYDETAFQEMMVYQPDVPELIYRYALFLYEEKYDIIAATEQLQRLQTEFPQFRVDEVQELLSEIEEGEGIGADGLPGRPVEILNAQHIAQGASHPPYNSVPPTSGWHYAHITDYGIHTEPIPDEVQIHNLEHGAVLIQYRPDVAEEMIADMRDFVENLRTDQGFCRLILAPYPELDRPVALTAWGRILKMDVFDRPIALSFAGYFLDQGPENVADCQIGEPADSQTESEESEDGDSESAVGFSLIPAMD